MSAHRYAETAMEGGLWGLVGHCAHLTKAAYSVGIPPNIVTREKFLNAQ